MKKLWLDDTRPTPDDEEWDRVRNYEEFTHYIETYGVPELISFDHDLGGQHYRDLFGDKKKTLLEEGFTEKNGYDCAKWMVKNNHMIKDYGVHSMNPIGKLNIETLLFNWKKWGHQKISWR